MSTTPQGGPGILLGLGGLTGKNNSIELAAGETYTIPSGQWIVTPGPYTFLQFKDPISGRWVAADTTPNSPTLLTTGGSNFRLANLTGCAVGAFITNVGSGYTSAPTVTASAGGSTWTAIVGGAVSGTVTITTAGAGYNYPPQLIIDAPPAGGIQATATCTLSSGAINAVTVVNQGAGYVSVPNITVVPDPREATAATPGPTTAAALTAALTGSGVVTAIVCTNHGSPQTAVPTLTISGGGGSSAAATATMCFTLTGYSVGTAGAAYGNAQPILTLAAGGIVAGSAGTVVNPALGPGMFTPRMGIITSTSTAGGALTTGGVIQDGGLFQAVPQTFTLAGNAVPTTQAVATLAVGGVSDQSWLQPII